MHGVRRTDSVHSDFTEDEYVIYNSNQQHQEYLVEFAASHLKLNEVPTTSPSLGAHTDLEKPLEEGSFGSSVVSFAKEASQDVATPWQEIGSQEVASFSQPTSFSQPSQFSWEFPQIPQPVELPTQNPWQEVSTLESPPLTPVRTFTTPKKAPKTPTKTPKVKSPAIQPWKQPEPVPMSPFLKPVSPSQYSQPIKSSTTAQITEDLSQGTAVKINFGADCR